MKYKLVIDKDAEEQIVAIVHAPSSLTEQIENLVEVTGYAVISCELFHNTFFSFNIDFLEWACYNYHAHILVIWVGSFPFCLPAVEKGFSFTRL